MNASVSVEAVGGVELVLAFRDREGELQELASTRRGRIELYDYQQQRDAG